MMNTKRYIYLHFFCTLSLGFVVHYVLYHKYIYIMACWRYLDISCKYIYKWKIDESYKMITQYEKMNKMMQK